MKKLLLLFGLIMSTFTNAWLIDGLGEYKFEKINDKVFVMFGPPGEPSVQNQGFMNNPAIILADKAVIVVDPGSAYNVGKQVLKEIRKITDKPIKAVFNTHVHGDHWLANQAIIEKYPDIKIYAHPQMISQAKNGEGQRWVDLMNTLTKDITKGTVATYPNKSTYHLQTITIAGEVFKIYNNNPAKKAHTNTDIMIEHVSSKTLFLGDNGLVDRLARFGNTSSMHGNIKMLEYAIDLNLDFYIPGHGPAGNTENAVKPFLNYLLITKKEVEKGYADDLADYEIKPTAIKKLNAYKNWHGFDNQVGKHIGKMLLEVEELDL